MRNRNLQNHLHLAHIHALLNESSDNDNGEATAALRLLQADISAICTPANAESTDHGITHTLQRKASRCAAKAIGARGTHNHPAWRDLVAVMETLLRHRSQYGDAGDNVARERLLAFVHENRDALGILKGENTTVEIEMA